MIWNFNLLATSEVLTRSQAASELWILLRALGDENPQVDRSPIKGLITAKTSIDAVEAIHKLRAYLQEHPGKFKTLLRIMPIDRVIATDLDELMEATKELSEKIDDDASFRVTLEKRKTDLRSLEVIDAVAGILDQKVDLVNPDWVLLIQILGKHTGVSVIHPEDLLNVQKEKAALSMRP